LTRDEEDLVAPLSDAELGDDECGLVAPLSVAVVVGDKRGAL